MLLCWASMSDKRIHNLWLVHFFADFIAIVTAYFLSMWIRFDSTFGVHLFEVLNRALDVRETGALGASYELFYAASAFRIICFLTIIVCSVYALRDLYTERRFIIREPVSAEILVANVIALGIIYTYFYLDRNVFHPRSFFALVLFLNVLCCVFYRAQLDRLLRWLRSRHGWDCWPVLLVGEGKSAALIEQHIREQEPHGLYIADRLVVSPHHDVEKALLATEASAKSHDVGMLIVVDNDMSVQQIMKFLELSDRFDLPVKIQSDKLDVLVNRARIRFDVAHGGALYHFAAVSSAERFQRSKQRVSQLLALIASVVALPVFACIALAVKLTSKGPAFYTQERIGRLGSPFRMIKFRTMYSDADARLSELEGQNESGDGLFKIRNDPRVTAVGKFLRRYSLDELPQLLNVVRGEMTLVGPRPLPRRDYENFNEDWHYGRHNGIPGLTCLWQVSGRSDLDFQSMCILDVFYLRNQTMVMDLKIMIRTGAVVLFAEGAY